ncbi:SDR family oxidoreductase [Oryzomonas japonica]|nr:SDR family oxidoreductase [Oryzomonas japonica]
MTIAWVIGSGGLLGAALCSALRRDGTELFLPSDRLRWGSYSELASQLEAIIPEFAAHVGASGRWEIYWAAGVGTMGSAEDVLASETRDMSLVLELLKSNMHLMTTSGAFAFASSAGAIYAGSGDDIITENTPPKPTTAYAHEKLKQEDMVRSLAVGTSRITVLIARISTLYGYGQAHCKQQGLLTHIARSTLRNQPIQIYVPYDTVRDYIASDDAAASMIIALRMIGVDNRILTKIIASEDPTTIAGIISIFKKILRGRGPRIVTSTSRLSDLYPRRMQFKSIVLPECAEIPKMHLLVGIAQLVMAERTAFTRGQL